MGRFVSGGPNRRNDTFKSTRERRLSLVPESTPALGGSSISRTCVRIMRGVCLMESPKLVLQKSQCRYRSAAGLCVHVHMFQSMKHFNNPGLKRQRRHSPGWQLLLIQRLALFSIHSRILVQVQCRQRVGVGARRPALGLPCPARIHPRARAASRRRVPPPAPADQTIPTTPVKGVGVLISWKDHSKAYLFSQ